MKRTILSILFLVFLTPCISNACECKIQKRLESLQNLEFENSECILIGEVLEIDSENDTFKVKVVESFNGDKTGKIYSGIYNRYCEPIIDQKGQWLIYGNINEQGLLDINSCGLTRSFAHPEKNFQIFSITVGVRMNKLTDKEEKQYIEKAKSDLINEIKILRTKFK